MQLTLKDCKMMINKRNVTMKNTGLTIILAFHLIQFISAKGNSSTLTHHQNLLNPPAQSGYLEFGSTIIDRYEGTTGNSEEIYLNDYTGMPLKALQFKIIIGNSQNKLIFKSLTRGKDIPVSLFLFDYEVHNGFTDNKGNPIKVVSVVLLGNSYNVLTPGSNYHIASINYDIVDLDSGEILTSLSFSDVMGATCMPVQDAGISAGKDEIIYLKKSKEVSLKEEILIQNYPNPFNPTTKIRFTIPNSAISPSANRSSEIEFVTLKVYDFLGSEVVTLIDEERKSGTYELIFDASLLTGNAGYVSGVYFYKLQSGSYMQTKKMLLLK
jgi:hypothetical protein